MVQLNSFQKAYDHLRYLLAKSYRRIYGNTEFMAVVDPATPGLTARALSQILSAKYSIVADSVYQPAGLASTIFKLSLTVNKMVLDLSAEEPGELDSSMMLIAPTTLVITRLLEPSLVSTWASLINGMPEDKTVLLNWDDPYCRRLADSTAGEVVYFGKDSVNCHVWAGNINIVNFQTSFELNYGVERVKITTPLLGYLQLEPLLAAAGLGIRAGVSLINIKKSLEQIEVGDSQPQPFKGFAETIVLDSSSSDHLLKVEMAIDVLNQLPARRRIIVVGEIGSTGRLPTSIYHQLARKIYKDRIDLVFTAGGDAVQIGEELAHLGFIPERLQINLSIQQIVAQLLKILAKGDVVLLAGSKAARLDEVLKKITRK